MVPSMAASTIWNSRRRASPIPSSHWLGIATRSPPARATRPSSPLGPGSTARARTSCRSSCCRSASAARRRSMNSTATLPTDGATIVYDGECPFCSRYVALQRLRAGVGQVHLVDAREGGPIVAALRARGLDLNEGMALIHQGRVYHGADAIHQIALLSSGENGFSRATSRLFKNQAMATRAYPVLRAGRNLALRLLGRKQIT